MSKKNNPFILWDNYNASNKNAFFGREKEIRDIKEKLETGLVVFYGPSGAGKSSICKAGIEPDIYIEDYTNDYLEKMLGIKNENFDAFINKIQSMDNPIISFDQFEKIFYDPDANSRFVKFVINYFLENPGFKFLIIIREESIGDLYKFSMTYNYSLLSDDTGFHLYKMERSKVIDVFSKIFAVSEIEVSEDFAITVVDTIEKATGYIELADIQAVGYELYEETTKKKLTSITSAQVYEKIDGFYNRLYEDLSNIQKNVLKRGISSTGERKKISSEAISEHEIANLINSRILKKVGKSYEIAHEYLVKHLLTGLSKNELDVIRVREMVERATQDFSYNPDLYLDAIRLNGINKHRDKLELDFDEIELVTKSSLINDFSKINREYWINRLSGFYPECMDLFISILELGIVDTMSKEAENQTIIVAAINNLYVTKKMNYEQFFNSLKYALLSSNREVVFKAIEVLPEINGTSIQTLLTLIDITPYYMFPEIYIKLFEKQGSGLLTEKICEWINSGQKHKVKLAYDYLKVNNVSPDEITLSFPPKDDKRYLDHLSYLAYNEMFELKEFDSIIEKMFFFDKNLLKYTKDRAKKDKDFISKVFNNLKSGTHAPFNLLFKKSEDFLDYEAYISKKDIKTTYIRKGVLDIKNFKTFVLLSFNTKTPDVYKTDFDYGLAILGKNNRYIIDFSTIDITSFDVTIGLMRSLAKIGGPIYVYSCCLSRQGEKKIGRFAHFAHSLDILWYI